MTPLLILATLVAPPLPVTPGVPVIPPGSRRPAGPTMLRQWNAGMASCDGVAQPAVVPPEPRPTAAYARISAAARIIALDFAIDGDGRPHAIRAGRSVPMPVGEGDDVVPALAAARFAAGAPRTGCAIRFFQRDDPIADAALQAAFAATIPPVTLAAPALFDRIQPTGSTCRATPVEPLQIAVPAFRTIPRTPGRAGWAVVRFDIAPDGRPAAVAIAASNGNAALDRAATRAVTDSRFVAEARRGCLRPFVQPPGTLAAPATPAAVRAPLPGASCPDGLPWTTPPALRFPENFRRRSIEGWAALRFDVATWGQPGNVRVIAAEPAAAFGDAAARMILAARKAPSPAGHVGCTVVVRYRIDARAPAAADPPAPF